MAITTDQLDLGRVLLQSLSFVVALFALIVSIASSRRTERLGLERSVSPYLVRAVRFGDDCHVAVELLDNPTLLVGVLGDDSHFQPLVVGEAAIFTPSYEDGGEYVINLVVATPSRSVVHEYCAKFVVEDGSDLHLSPSRRRYSP